MKRLPWLLLLAALILPGLAIVPHSQHVFWVPESVVACVLAPWAAFAAWLGTRREPRAALPWGLAPVFAALALLWALAGALALRQDLAAQALIEWLSYAALFFATWRLAATPLRRRLLLAALLAYGLLSALYAVVQALGLDPIHWSTGFDGRAGAFFGNPNFLGGHLALLLPLSLALALDRREGSSWRRLAPWALVAALAGALVLTQTRGAWIGATVGCAVVLAAGQRWMGGLVGRNRKPLAVLGLLGLLGLGGFFALKPGAWTRWRSALQSQDSELAHRFFLMHKSAQLAGQHPLLGVGPGNFRIHFAQVQVQGLQPKDYHQPYVSSEHAHNDFLQMAAEAGIPAALLWAALMGLLLLALLQALRPEEAPLVRRGDGLLVLGVLGGTVALLVHGLANFPFLILPTQSAAWALAALALRAGARSLAEPLPEPPVPSRSAQSVSVVLLSLGLALAAANSVWQGRRLNVDRFWWIGQGELQLNHAERASGWLLSGIGIDKREDRLYALHGRSEIERELIWNGIGSLRESYRLAPYDPEVAVRLGRALLENKQYEEADRVLSSVAAYAPNFYDVWEPLAACLYFEGKHAEAVKAYDWMIFFNVNPENAYVNKAAALGSEGKLPDALMTLKDAQQRFPDKAKIYLNLAITYLKLGMRTEARAALHQAQVLDPSDPQLKQLHQVLR